MARYRHFQLLQYTTKTMPGQRNPAKLLQMIYDSGICVLFYTASPSQAPYFRDNTALLDVQTPYQKKRRIKKQACAINVFNVVSVRPLKNSIALHGCSSFTRKSAKNSGAGQAVFRKEPVACPQDFFAPAPFQHAPIPISPSSPTGFIKQREKQGLDILH